MKPSLRWLAEKHLGQSIQTNESGHDSIEDAKTAMSLVKLKLEKGTIGIILGRDRYKERV